MRNIKNLALLSLCLFLIIPDINIFAQTKNIHGVVINAITNNKIPGIKVEVKGFKETAISNATGEYTLTIPDSMKTIPFAEIPGMDIIEIRYNGSNNADIYLSEVDAFNLSMEDLMKIKITTAGKTEQEISIVPASVVVINRADIENYGYQSLEEILSNVLGMYKIDDYRSVNFGVRGFFSNVYNRNIIFMINGVIQKQPYHSWNYIPLMNLQVECIERIEVVRGPVAIIYGNDAFFGAINIITHQKGISSKSSATVAYGNDNTYRGNVQINSATESTTINLTAGYYHTDGRDFPFNKILDSVQRYDKTWIKDATTKDFFRQNSNYFNLSMDHKGFYANLSYDETYRNLIQLWPPILDTVKLTRDDFMFRGNIGCFKKISSIFSFDIHADFESMVAVSQYAKGLITPDIKYGNTNVEARKTSVELITFIKPIELMNITLGANYSIIPRGSLQTDIPAVGTFSSNEILHTPCVSYAAYSQAEYAISPKIRLLAGVRADKQDGYDFKNTRYVSNVYQDTFYSYNYNKVIFIPRAAIVYNIDDKNILKLMYSDAISRPGVYENSYVNWTKHPLLVPQTIATTELNYSGIPINNINYSLSMFYNRLDKLINRRTTSSASGSIITENNNTGKMETIGGELQVIFKPVDKLMLDVSMSYQKTTNKIFDIDAAYSPKVLAYLKVIYNIRKDIIFGFSSYYVGNMESEWDEAPVDPKNGNFTPKGRLYKTTPAYLNLGANLRFNNILNTGFYFSVHADNILNTDIYYPPTTLNISYLPKGTLDNGIQLNATLGLKF